LKLQFQHRFAAIGTGTFISVIQAHTARIEAANLAQLILSQFSVDGAASILQAHGTAVIESRYNFRIGFRRRIEPDVQARIQPAS